jgi:hypothetical protein
MSLCFSFQPCAITENIGFAVQIVISAPNWTRMSFATTSQLLEINSAFLEKKISAEDRTKQLSEIQKNIEILNEANKG